MRRERSNEPSLLWLVAETAASRRVGKQLLLAMALVTLLAGAASPSHSYLAAFIEPLCVCRASELEYSNLLKKLI